MKKLLVLPLLLFLCTPYLMQAQQATDEATIENTIGFGPRLGYYKATDAEDGAFYGGLQTRVRLGAVLGLEGSIEYRAGQEYSFEVGGIEQSVTTSFVPVTGSALLYLPVSKNITPYGVAGLGAYYTIYDYEGDFENQTEDEFNFGYHLGFGVEFPITRHSALNFDYRYLFLNPDENEASTYDADYSGNVFTAGLMFYF